MNKVFDYIRCCLNEGVGVNLAFSWWALWGSPVFKDPLMCHKWGYTNDSATELLKLVGFEDVTEEDPRYHFKDRDMRLTARKGLV